MKRYVAKMMRESLGPKGSDLYRGTSAKKKRAIGKVAFRKWKSKVAKAGAEKGHGGYLPSDAPVWCSVCEAFHTPRKCAKPVTLPPVSGEIVTP